MVYFRVNTFTIEDEEDLTALSKIEVMRDGRGNEWYLEEVSFKLKGCSKGCNFSGKYDKIFT